MFGAPPQSHGDPEPDQPPGVDAGGGVGDGGQRPADPLVVVDGQAEFFGQSLVLLVVVAVLAAGVLDAAGGGQGVGGFVQQGAQDGARVAAQPFAADEDFGQGAAGIDGPPPRGEVAPFGDPAAGPARDDDDRGRDLGMPVADGLPVVFQDGNDRA